jgi:hypothetical protein
MKVAKYTLGHAFRQKDISLIWAGKILLDKRLETFLLPLPTLTSAKPVKGWRIGFRELPKSLRTTGKEALNTLHF